MKILFAAFALEQAATPASAKAAKRIFIWSSPFYCG